MWINPQTLAVYSLHSEIRAAFPNVSFPASMSEDDIASVGLVPFQVVQPPAFDPITHALAELAPEQDELGLWRQAWAVADLPPEVAAERLNQARAAKKAEINAWRLQANRSSFEHAGKAFACDELSRSDIDGITSFVTLVGSLPPGWPGAWKAVDNSYLPITSVADWTAFVASMVSTGNANFAKSQALKAAVDAATTTVQINSITW